MRTRRPPISLEGTLEIIDLSHASEEEAAMTVLQEMRARRSRRPHAANGPALVIELDRVNGAPGAPAADPAAGEPSAPRRAHADGSAHGEAHGIPFSLADLGEVLFRRVAQAVAEASEPEAEPESAPEAAPAAGKVEERAEVMEQFLAQRTLIIDDDGLGKVVTAAVVGFGLGAATMFLANRTRRLAPPSSYRERPRRPYHPTDAAWRAELDEIERAFGDGAGDEQDDDEPSPEVEHTE